MCLDNPGTHSYDVDSRCSPLNRKPPLVLVLCPSPSSVDGASGLNVHCLQLVVGSGFAHTKEAALCDMSA